MTKYIAVEWPEYQIFMEHPRFEKDCYYCPDSSVYFVPDAYGIDFGVTKDGRTLLIEVNDAWALGCYGLESHLYAKFLLTRWAQLTDTPDQFFYI